MNNMRNKVQLIGKLGADPDFRNLEGGKSLARISLATNETYKNNKGERVTETQWHNLVAWGKTAELANKYLTKGREIAVEGKLINRTWEDKDGKKNYITEVVVNEFLMFDTKEKAKPALQEQ